MSSQFCSHDHLHFFFSLLSLCALTYLPLSIDYIIKDTRQLFICQNRNCCCFILKHLVLKHLDLFSMKASLLLIKYEDQLDNEVVGSTVKTGNASTVILFL